MNRLSILLLSKTRPSRTWRVAERLLREVQGLELCGIVQLPMQSLPLVQQLIASAASDSGFLSSNGRSRMQRRLHAMQASLIDWVLWFVHGSPPSLNDSGEFTISKLAKKCQEGDYPFRVTDCADERAVCEFVRDMRPRMIIVLGDVPICAQLRSMPLCGLLRISDSEASGEVSGSQLTVEYYGKDSDTAFPIASLTVPLELYDELSAFTLKLDLMADDLLTQTVMSMKGGNVARASIEVGEWVHTMLSPYLAQLEPLPSPTEGVSFVKPYRSVWKLCLETLLLCSPIFVSRNWYRRWRSQYPVLILAHHLISDRAHRMGVPTSIFWRAIRFLKRYYRLVSLPEAIQLLSSGSVTSPTIAITFDDGYGENFVNLRAVAQEAGLPVALFVSIKPVDEHRQFEHDLLQGATGAFPLTWDQVRYWGVRGAEFGSHTRTHFDCGSTDQASLESEITDSRNDLEDRLGQPVRFFAFPYGKQPNMSRDAIQMAAATYPHFLSCFGGDNLPNQKVSCRHLLRKNFYPCLWELELELQSIFDLVDRVKQKFHSGPTESAHVLDEIPAASALLQTERRFAPELE